MDTGATNPTCSPLIGVNAQTSVENLAEKREIVQAVQALNKAEAFGPKQELTYSFDRESRRTVVKVVDRTTGEVLQQIPTEEILRLARVAKR